MITRPQPRPPSAQYCQIACRATPKDLAAPALSRSSSAGWLESSSRTANGAGPGGTLYELASSLRSSVTRGGRSLQLDSFQREPSGGPPVWPFRGSLRGTTVPPMSTHLIPGTSPIRLTRQGAALRCAYQQGLAIRQELPPRETGASQRANPCGSHGFQPDSFRATLRGVFQTNPPGGRFAVCLPAGTGSRLRSSSDTSSSREHPARARSLPRGGPPGAGPSGGPLRLPSGMRLVVIPPRLQSLRIRPSRARTGFVCLVGNSSVLPTSGIHPPPTSVRIARSRLEALMRRVAGELSEGC